MALVLSLVLQRLDIAILDTGRFGKARKGFPRCRAGNQSETSCCAVHDVCGSGVAARLQSVLLHHPNFASSASRFSLWGPQAGQQRELDGLCLPKAGRCHRRSGAACLLRR